MKTKDLLLDQQKHEIEMLQELVKDYENPNSIFVHKSEWDNMVNGLNENELLISKLNKDLEESNQRTIKTLDHLIMQLTKAIR